MTTRACAASLRHATSASRPKRTLSSAWRATRGYASVSAAHLQFGQPVHETHPHILKAGEITPGITAQEYADRRAALAQALPRDSVAVLPAADLKYRTGAVFHPYRQESNFLYLTGFCESEALAVIRKTGDGHDDYQFHLFARSKDAAAEQWMGPWSGLDAARDVFNADEVNDIKRAEAMLPDLLRQAKTIYTDVSSAGTIATTQLESVIRNASKGLKLSALQPTMNELRVIKSKAEIANMRKAGQVSGRAITEAMRREWSTEKDLASFLDYSFRSGGCDGSAYIPVIAGGSRARLIHYVHNNAALNKDELVLVDAGAEYGFYIADISRTWPVGGKFSQPQRDLYEALLRVQRSVVSMCSESTNQTLDGLHQITKDSLRDQLKQLGFDTSGDAIDTLFPHHVGHHIGLDVHDCPGYSRTQKLRTGNCITIEPGLYVPDDDRWPKHFRGMGLRIEDSVCIDDNSPYVFSTEAVKEVVDIEALRA